MKIVRVAAVLSLSLAGCATSPERDLLTSSSTVSTPTVAVDPSGGSPSTGGGSILATRERSASDGLYLGWSTPDEILETRGGCPVRKFRNAAFIHDGAVIFSTGTGGGIYNASGELSLDGHADLQGLNRGITLMPSKEGFTGRALAGSGPWCKSSIELTRATGPARPNNLVNSRDGIYHGFYTPHRNIDSGCFQDPVQKELWIRNGIEFMGWGDGGIFGYVQGDSNIELVGGEKRWVRLSLASDGSYVGETEGLNGRCRGTLQLQKSS